jgi:hypothetical protein
MKRKEFIALVEENKSSFKKEVMSLIEKMISKRVTDLYIKESAVILKTIKCESKQKEKLSEEVLIEPVQPFVFPVREINDAILYERTCWLTAKDGSQLEITSEMAKYLAELYNSLNTLHKDKLIKLITESEYGFKKAVKTAQKLYRR